MDLKNLILILAAAGGIMPPASAQSVSGEKAPGRSSNPVERIMEESEGNVVIDIPADILERILKDDQQSQRNGGAVLRPGINKMSGFRVQVFSDGHNQHSLESRAKARGSAIVARFPKYRGQVYSFSSSPNWYTRIGNFRTSEEASAAMAELKRAFPQFAAEMRVVRSQIVVIK
ncbi:MAG: SPOR domain-containing protein [Muribaculaceae bacterium]|nr:SPOR domain-containing protein [Muribaculaceae bacterium]